MAATTTVTHYDAAVEMHAMRRAGMPGSGKNTHQIFSIDYDSLPPEARATIQLIFYIITGMSSDLRNAVQAAIKAAHP
jgi:hypothetical protein